MKNGTHRVRFGLPTSLLSVSIGVPVNHQGERSERETVSQKRVTFGTDKVDYKRHLIFISKKQSAKSVRQEARAVL